MPTPVIHYVYRSSDGREASCGGAAPYRSLTERIIHGWRLVEDGWTIRWDDGTTGGCPRFQSQHEAEIWIRGVDHEDFVDDVWMPVWEAAFNSGDSSEARRLLIAFSAAIADYLSGSSDEPAADWRQIHELLDLEPRYIDSIHGVHNAAV